MAVTPPAPRPARSGCRAARATPARRAHGWLVAALLAAATAPACSEFIKPELPGETTYTIDEVTFPENLVLSPKPLKPVLAVRPSAFLIAGQPYNPYRLAEDRRRIGTFWKNFGFFDVEVDKGLVTFDDAKKSARVAWSLREGERYHIRAIQVQGAPTELETAVRAEVPFAVGDRIDVQTYRMARHALCDVLRKQGWMRAEVYSRTYVDHAAHAVDWYYFVDPGPRSVVGKVEVVGARKIPKELIIDRAGLEPGQPLTLDRIEKLELDLADLGAFNTARVYAETGTEFQTNASPYETWIPPDTGGILKPEQVSESGALVARNVPAEVDVKLSVVESPTAQGSLDVGINMDPERIDPYVTTRLWWRNAFGPLHHLTLRGTVGWGIRWRSDIDEPLGLYGNARLMWNHPGTIGRTGDLRLTLAFDEELYRGFHTRTASAGLGLRFLLAPGMFFDLEPRFRWDSLVGLGAIDPAAPPGTAEGLSTKDSLAGEARLGFVWDTRNDGVEALSGHLIGLHLAAAPVGDLTWLRGDVDLRVFVPFGLDMGLGFRAQAGWAVPLGGDDAAMPMATRMFGGGAWGTRGFGTRELSPYARACGGAAGAGDCRQVPVGGESLFEGAVEFRWLPFRQQFGAVAFVDFGAAGAELNPFAEGIDIAPGLGLRVRLWHLSAALDFAYRVTSGMVYPGVDRFQAFFRIGEAF